MVMLIDPKMHYFVNSLFEFFKVKVICLFQSRPVSWWEGLCLPPVRICLSSKSGVPPLLTLVVRRFVCLVLMGRWEEAAPFFPYVSQSTPRPWGSGLCMMGRGKSTPSCPASPLDFSAGSSWALPQGGPHTKSCRSPGASRFLRDPTPPSSSRHPHHL